MKRLLRIGREIPGWHTSKKMVVLESDDWGAIRMPSSEVWHKLKQAGLPVDDPFAKNDALATPEDLSKLFEVLNSVEDSTGNPAVLTANTVMTNPDFEDIATADFKKYYGEHFTKTLQRTKATKDSFYLWQEGMERGVFHPQYHGREHLNIVQWMRILKSGDKEAKTAFDLGVYGINFSTKISKRSNLMATMDYDTEAEKQTIIEQALEGLQMFQDTFGYASKSFIAPAYVWSPKIEEALQQGGVRFIQGITTQSIPNPGKEKYARKYHYTGKKNSWGQRYLVRNCFFEPAINPSFDWVGDCLQRMELIFMMKKPVILASHRLNFMGAIHPENRTQNLQLLGDLLHKMVQRWPDIIFTTSDVLGEEMER